MAQPVEAKVKACTVGALVAGIIVAALGRWVFRGSVPAGYTVEIDAAVPAVLAAVAGWLAPHTPRPVPPAPVQAVPPPPAADPPLGGETMA